MNLKNIFPSNNIIRKHKLASTNAYAQDLLINTDLMSGTVVLTYNQTNGRGQLTNQWESEIGKNLTISVILRPDFVSASEQFNISRLISLAIYDVLNYYIDNVTIKWPNDIYVGDSKIAGVLIENTIMGSNIEYSICGIGLNVNQKIFISKAPNPTSMSIEAKKIFDTEEILKLLIEKIQLRFDFLKNHNSDSLSEDYMLCMYRNKGMYKYSDSDSEFLASIEGVNAFGQLQLRRENGLLSTYSFKEVSFII